VTPRNNISLPSGEHSLELVHPAFGSIKETILLKKNQKLRVKRDLTKKPD